VRECSGSAPPDEQEQSGCHHIHSDTRSDHRGDGHVQQVLCVLMRSPPPGLMHTAGSLSEKPSSTNPNSPAFRRSQFPGVDWERGGEAPPFALDRVGEPPLLSGASTRQSWLEGHAESHQTTRPNASGAVADRTDFLRDAN
jgi:hypothetical protein